MSRKIEQLKRALVQSPDSINLLLGLTREFEGMGNYYRARKYLRRILKLRPSHSEALNMLQSIEGRFLIQKYSGYKSFYKWQEILARGRAGDAAVVNEVIKGLDERSKWVRKECIHALGEIATEKALGALIGAISRPALSPLVEKTLKKACEKKPSLNLLRKIKINNRQTCINIIIYLGFKRSPDAADALLGIARDRHEDKWIRGSASWALGQIGDINALDTLKDMMYDDDEEYVREESEEAYHRILDRLYQFPSIKNN